MFGYLVNFSEVQITFYLIKLLMVLHYLEILNKCHFWSVANLPFQIYFSLFFTKYSTSQLN